MTSTTPGTIYVDVIGGTVIHEGVNDLLKTRSIFVAIGHDDIVELAEPLESGTPIADYLEANHHGLFSVTLQVEDLGAAAAYLRSKEHRGPPRERGVVRLRSRDDPRGPLGRHDRRDPQRLPPGLVTRRSQQR